MTEKTKNHKVMEKKLEQLYTENRGKWHGYAARYGISAHDAEDIIQNIMITLLMKKDKLIFFSTENLEAYAMESLKNAVRNSLARTKHCEPLDEDLSIMETPESIVLDHLEYENVRDAIKQLSEIQRKIIHKMYYENKKVVQIAEELGKQENIIYTYSRRAILVLKKYLKKLDEGGEKNEPRDTETGD